MGFGKVLAGIAAALAVADVAYSAANNSSYYLRPPGIQGEADFMARCIKCGKCAQACPHGVIKIARDLDMQVAGTPYIDPEEAGCRLCPTYPCVEACPTTALRDVADKSDVHMGYAFVNENTCIAFRGLRCEVCYRICPLIDQAITIDFQELPGDNIHTRFIPKVNKDICTGCGLCVQRCVVRDPRAAIQIVTLAEQEAK